MPQAAWEALFWNEVQGLGPHYTPETRCRWVHTTGHPAWAIGARQAPTRPHHQHTGQREGPRQRGEGRPWVAGRCPQGQGARGNATRGQGTTGGGGKGKARSRSTGVEGAQTSARTHTKEGHPTLEGPAPPHPPPSRHCATRRGARPPRRTAAAWTRCRTNRTGSRPPTTGPRTGEGGYTHTGGRGYTHTESHREHGATLHHTSTARQPSRPQQGPPHRRNGTDTRGGRGHGRHTHEGGRQGGRGTEQEGTQHTRGDHDTPPDRTQHTPRSNDPQRTRAQGTGPRGRQPRGHPPDPPGQMAHPAPRNTHPTSCPTPNCVPRPSARHITSARIPHNKAGLSNQHRRHRTPERR